MYDPAKREIKLTFIEGKRFKKLGDIGESIAMEVLLYNQFQNIVDLNEVKANFPFADYSAKRDGKKYLISVKARNKYERSGRINSRYKLGAKVYEQIETLLASDEWRDYIPAWLAISIEPKCFDAYFGLIEQLNGGRGINMSDKAKRNYETFALNNLHDYDFSDFGNVYEKKC